MEGGARLAMRQQPARIWVTSSGFAPGRGDGERERERERHRCQDGADLSGSRPQRPGCPRQGELRGPDPAPTPQTPRCRLRRCGAMRRRLQGDALQQPVLCY